MRHQTKTRPAVAVIGAGAAGLTAGSLLAESAADVTVVDKSRGFGGRLATRRTDGFAFDHGCPLVEPVTGADRALLDRLAAAGAAASWMAGEVGVPGMSALLKPLATGLTVRTGFEVARLVREFGGWWLYPKPGDAVPPLGPFDWLLVTAPAPQAATLLADLPSLAETIGRAVMAPRWTLMLVPDGGLGLACDRFEFAGDPILSHAIRNDRKPGRPGPESWTVHARSDWSAANLEMGRERARDALLAAVRNALPQGYPRFVAVHRWRHAEVAKPLGRPCLVDPASRVAAGGDWCLGPKVADAFASGRALAEAVRAEMLATAG